MCVPNEEIVEKRRISDFLASSQELVNRLTVGSENPMNEPFFTANAIIARYHLNSPMRTGPH